MSSTQLVTDENGDQVARFIYGAWGEELYASESVPGVLENRFVGGLGCRKDAATGLIYMRHRWYDPALQRFISRDPIGLKGGNNLYQYAGNNPVKSVDPVGLKCLVTAQDDTQIDKYKAALERETGLTLSIKNGKLTYDSSVPRNWRGTDGVAAETLRQIIDNTNVTVQIELSVNNPEVNVGAFYGYGRQGIDLGDISRMNSADSHQHGDAAISHEMAEAYYGAKYGLSQSGRDEAHNAAGIPAENSSLQSTGGGWRTPDAGYGDFGNHQIDWSKILR